MDKNYDYEGHLNEITTYGYQFNISEYINRGFQIFGKNPWGFIGYTLLVSIIQMLASYTLVGSLLVSGPLTAGFYIMAKKIDHGEHFEFSTFFKGFDHFVQLLLASLVVGAFTFLGFLFLIIPGIYLAVAYSFVTFFVIFVGIDFWKSMEYSMKVINKNWFGFLGLLIIAGIIAVAGILLLGVGLLASMPIAACILYAAFADIVGTGNYLENDIDRMSDDDYGTDDNINDSYKY